MRITRVIFGIVVILSLYFTQLTIIITNQFIFKNEITLFCYSLPLIIMVLIAISLFCSFRISESLYCKIYIIMGLYMGYLLYSFQSSLLLRLLNLFFSLSISINVLLLYLIPFVICIYGVINALVTRVEYINIKYPGFKGKLRILLLSDIHLGAIHQKNSIIRIVNETKQLKPDIVVITGDMADGSLRVKHEWLKPFDDLTIPILFVTGNHEELNPKTDMIKVVNQTNIKYIGKHERYKFKGVNFIGEDFGYDLKKCLLNVQNEPGVPNVLLYHVPNLIPDELEKYNIFLFLAGHTHGGQIFPLGLFAYLANACFSGLYIDKTKSHYIYVSEGVNNAVVPMRVGSSRIFALITIEGEN